MELTKEKFNINNFCKDSLFYSRYDFATPWQKDGKVYATDGNILFIGKASDYPEIQLDDKQKPNIETLGIDKVSQYTPVIAGEIEEILEFHPPKIEMIYETKECGECQGNGFKKKIKCSECGQIHEKECSKCQGEGEIKTTKIISQKIEYPITPFRNTLLNWKYLNLIKDSMQALGGEWQVSETKPLDMIVFKNEDATIAVMPMRK